MVEIHDFFTYLLNAKILHKKLSYRKETVRLRLLHNIEIVVLHESRMVLLIRLFQSNRERRLTFRQVLSRSGCISRRCLSIMRLFSVTCAYIAINDISLKTRFFGLHFRRRLRRSIFNHFDVIGPQSYRIRRKNETQDNGHYAVQGHSRSPILVPIESPYATSH